MQTVQPERIAVETCRNQFHSSYHMLCMLVDVCPDSVWFSCYYAFPYPIWYQVYHVVYFVDFWLREAYEGSEFRSMVFDGRIAPEFEHEPPEGVTISRADMKACLDKVGEKLERVFDTLTDARLTEPILPEQDKFTYLDVITTQQRHIMYNIGYLNGILRSLDLPEADWYAYNEDADAE